MLFSLPAEVLLVFFSASVLLALSPGPDNFYVLSQSVLHDAKTGIAITLGLCTGLIFHTGLVVLGVTALIHAAPIALVILKLIGALYLMYLAINAFRSGTRSISQSSESRNWVAHYQRGIVMNISNPKVGLFFLSLLPQFTDASAGPIEWQLVTLGIVFMLATLLVFSSIAAFAGLVNPWLQSKPSAQKILNAFAGIVFLLIAITIIFTSIPDLT